MNILFTLDEKNYTDTMPVNERFAVRAIVKKGDKYAVQQSCVGDYKIPGGGIESNEGWIEALIREVSEETGLIVNADSIRAIGEVLEVRADDFQAGYKFVHHSYYFQCDVEEGKTEIHMTDEEFKRGYNFLWVKLEDIIENNLKICKEKWTLRDTRFLQWLREHNL